MPRYLNSPDCCILCFLPPEGGLKLIKHHASYDPEVIAYVHYRCHQKIHDPENPVKFLIQFTPDEVKKFYAKKKKKNTKPDKGLTIKQRIETTRDFEMKQMFGEP